MGKATAASTPISAKLVANLLTVPVMSVLMGAGAVAALLAPLGLAGVALWVMELSARVFGVNSWSILVPQALEGVAAVGLLYLTVRRWFGVAAGLIAGAVMAFTPMEPEVLSVGNADVLRGTGKEFEAIGGLLNATFGNAAEPILVLFLTHQAAGYADHDVVHIVGQRDCRVTFGQLTNDLRSLQQVPAGSTESPRHWKRAQARILKRLDGRVGKRILCVKLWTDLTEETRQLLRLLEVWLELFVGHVLL